MCFDKLSKDYICCLIVKTVLAKFLSPVKFCKHALPGVLTVPLKSQELLTEYKIKSAEVIAVSKPRDWNILACMFTKCLCYQFDDISF